MIRVIDHRSLGSPRERISTGALLLGIAVVAIGILWFGYGRLGPMVYATDPMPVPGWFRWEAPALPTMGLAVLAGASLPLRRGLIGLVALVVAVVVGLGVGVALGGELDGSTRDRALVAFAAGTVVVLTVCWLVGVATRFLSRRDGPSAPPERAGQRRSGDLLVRHDALAGNAAGLSVWFRPITRADVGSGALIVALIVLMLAGLGYLRGFLGSPEPSFRPSTQAGAGATITIGRVLWDAEDHAFLPRVGERTVAVRPRYEATGDAVAYAASDWSARDDRGGSYETAIWPNRNPLGAGTLRPGDRLFGWIAFVVPDTTDWLDVTLHTTASSPVTWRVDDSGARITTVETAQ